MSFKLDKSKIITFLVILLFSICIISFSIFLGKDYALFEDDILYSTYLKDEKLFDCLDFNFRHGGGYIGFFLSKFLSFGLPNMLGIHPVDFTQMHLAIKGGFTIIALLLLAKFSTFYSKSKYIYSSIFCLLSFYYFYLNLKLNTLISGVSYSYYRYSFSLIFFSIFVYYLSKILLSKAESKNKKALIFAIISGFIAGTSSEIVFESLGIFVLLIIFYQVVLSKIISNVEKFNLYKLNISKNFFYPVNFLFIAILCFISSTGFKKVVNERGFEDIVFSFDLIKEFLIEFFNLYILSEIWFWIIFLVIIIINFRIAYNKKEINKALIPTFLLVSIICSILSLVVCGKTFYEEGEFWLVHHNIQFIFIMLVVVPFLMNLSYLIKNTNIKKQIKFVIPILCLIYLAMIVKINNSQEIIKYNQHIKFLKEHCYKIEKIFRFYHLQGKIPYLPGYIVTRDIYKFELPREEVCKMDKYNNFLRSYYPNIYNDSSTYYMLYCVSDKAYERFYSLGGTFTQDELSDIKFSRLFDENFVLNKK